MDHRLLRSGSSIVFSQAPQLERPLAHLSAIRFEGLSPQDRGFGPIRVRADPKRLEIVSRADREIHPSCPKGGLERPFDPP
jgi:hypothetical protein